MIRRRRALIAIVTGACFALALINALSKDEVYKATAQIQFRDPLADLNLVGLSGETVPELAPGQRSALNAELVTSPEVTRDVARSLDAPVEASALSAAIDTRVDPATNLVVLEASWGDPEFAAQLANAYADAAGSVAEGEFEQRLERAEDALQDQLADARDDLPAPGEAAGAVGGGATFRVAALEQNLTQLRSLAEVAEPAQIVGRASPPASPASPRPVRDAILGLFVGLVLGLLVAFVRDSLDRRLRTAHEAHEDLGMPVLGTVGEAAFAYAGLAGNGSSRIPESEFEPFRVLRMNLAALSADSPPRSVLVTSPLAGEGKSTVSMSLASAAALAGQRVLLVECDLRRPSLAKRMSLRQSPGLTDYLSGDAGPGDILQVVELRPPAPVNGAGSRPSRIPAAGSSASLVCITAGRPVTTAPELLRSPAFRQFLEKVVKAYDLVVLDGSPMLAVSDPLEVVPAAHALLICVRAGHTTREQARAVRAALGHLPERPAGAVLTGVHPGEGTYGYYYGY